MSDPDQARGELVAGILSSQMVTLGLLIRTRVLTKEQVSLYFEDALRDARSQGASGDKTLSLELTLEHVRTKC